MSTPLPLDTRQARIARHLLETVGPASVDDLATELKLTDRMVRYNLASVESVLDGHGLRLARRRGVGIWVEGSPTAPPQPPPDPDPSPAPPPPHPPPPPAPAPPAPP